VHPFKPRVGRARLGTAAAVALLLICAGGAAHARPPELTHAAVERCHSAVLGVSLGGAGVAVGHVGEVVSFRNHSAARCTLYGYPGLQMLNAARRKLATEVLRGIAYTVPAVPRRVVTLAPGAEASFDVGYEDATGYGFDHCPTSSSVEITPPGAYDPITVTWRIQPFGGSATHLRCGQITVSAVFARR
jgi:hypothetical protein